MSAPCGGADVGGGGCVCDPPWLHSADQMRAERDAYKNDRDWFEAQLRERTAELRVARHRLDEVRKLCEPETWDTGNVWAGDILAALSSVPDPQDG